RRDRGGCARARGALARTGRLRAERAAARVGRRALVQPLSLADTGDVVDRLGRSLGCARSDRGLHARLVLRDRASVPARAWPGDGLGAGCSLVAFELLDQPLRRDGAERVLDDAADLVPVEIAVEADAEPAPMPHVRRHEELVRVGVDEQLLVAGRGGAPDREAPVAVVLVGP